MRALSFLAPNMLPVYQFMIEAISRRLGWPIVLEVGVDYDQALDCDLTFICGLPYILYAPRLEALAAPVLQGTRFQDRPIYFSDVIVHRDSPFQTFADLRGCSWAYNEPLSQSGYGITRHHLLQLGQTNGFFGQVIEAGFHEKAIEMVSRGEVAASAIDVQVLLVAQREQPHLAEALRVIATLGPSTIQPLAAAAHLPPSLKADIQAVVSELHTEPAGGRAMLDAGFIARWVRVSDSDYDDIRGMLAACERARFLRLR